MLSEHALDEVFTVIFKKYGGGPAFDACSFLFSTKMLDIVKADEEDWRKAIEYGRKFGISFTDAINLVEMEDYSVKKIVSFDSDFDRIRGIIRVH